MNEIAKDLIVLDAISNEINQFDKIVKVTKIEPGEINNILKKLEERKLINVQEKKGWLSKKIELQPTEKGNNEVKERIHELEEKWENMKNVYEFNDKQKLQQIMKDEKSFLPTMMFFGIIDMMMFSMMGIAMSSYMPTDDMSRFDDAENEDLDNSNMDDGGFDIDIGF